MYIYTAIYIYIYVYIIYTHTHVPISFPNFFQFFSFHCLSYLPLRTYSLFMAMTIIVIVSLLSRDSAVHIIHCQFTAQPEVIDKCRDLLQIYCIFIPKLCSVNIHTSPSIDPTAQAPFSHTTFDHLAITHELVWKVSFQVYMCSSFMYFVSWKSLQFIFSEIASFKRFQSAVKAFIAI